jgi:opacity protein-like surface antigen
MNRIVSIAVFLLLIASIAAAQDAPKVEVFGGYSLIHEAHLNLNGFAAEYEYNFGSHFGLVGDFSYGRKHQSAPIKSAASTTFDDFLLMGGPRLSYRADKARIFFHALAGGTRLKIKGPSSGFGISITEPFKGIAMAFGGGVDFPINSRISVRPAQLEWVKVRASKQKDAAGAVIHPTLWADQFRYSAGIVIKLGGQ